MGGGDMRSADKALCFRQRELAAGTCGLGGGALCSRGRGAGGGERPAAAIADDCALLVRTRSERLGCVHAGRGALCFRRWGRPRRPERGRGTGGARQERGAAPAEGGLLL